MNVKECENDSEYHWFIDKNDNWRFCPYCGGKLIIQVTKRMLENETRN